MSRILEIEHFYRPDGWLSPGYITIDDVGVISAVDADRPTGDMESLSGFGVPGMPNIHSHAFQRALAGRCETVGGVLKEDNLWTWRKAMYALTRGLTPEIYEAIGAFIYLEMVKHGFTSVGEFHYVHHQPGGIRFDQPAEMGLRLMRAAADVGIGMTMLPVLYMQGGVGKPINEDQKRFSHNSLDAFARLQETLKDYASPRDRTGLALHSLRAVPPREIADITSVLSKSQPGIRIHIHASETVHEVTECLAGLGARPVQWLIDNVGLDDNWTVVHAMHLDESECGGLARSGAVAGLCPVTEATMGDGFFPLVEYHEYNGCWGIGTDSHYVASPAMELRMLENGKRLQTSRRNLLADPASKLTAHTGRRLFDLALSGGVRAIGQGQGALSVGARADLVMLDSSSPTLIAHGIDTLFDAWILGGTVDPVRDVMIAGEWVVKDFRHRREERIVRNYTQAMKQLVAA